MNVISLSISIVFFLIPAISFIVGTVSKKNPPKEINKYKGYRTARSMASQEAWDYANRRMGELLVKSSLQTFIVGIVAAVILIATKLDPASIAFICLLLIVMIAQTFMMVFATSRIEKELLAGEHNK